MATTFTIWGGGGGGPKFRILVFFGQYSFGSFCSTKLCWHVCFNFDIGYYLGNGFWLLSHLFQTPISEDPLSWVPVLSDKISSYENGLPIFEI